MDRAPSPRRKRRLPRVTAAVGVCAVVVGLLASTSVSMAQATNADASFGEVSNYQLRLSADTSRQRRVEADVSSALAELLPKVTVGGEWVLDGSREYYPKEVAQDDPTLAKRDASLVALEASLVVFDGSKRRNLLHAAESMAEAGRATTLDTRQRLYFEAAGLTLAVIRDRSIVQRCQGALARQKQTYRIARERLQDHAATWTDLELAASRVNEAAANLEGARGEREASELAFAKLFGQRPSIGLVLSVPSSRLPPNPNSAALGAERGAPSVTAARQTMEAARFKADAARSAFFPTVELVGRGSVSFKSTPQIDRVDNYTGLIRVRIPLFDPTLKPAVEAAQADAMQSVYASESTRLSASMAARAGFARIRALNAQRAELGRQIENARRAVSSMEVERKLGTRLLIEVLDAQSNLSQAEIVADRLGFERDSAVFELLATMGELAEGDVPNLQKTPGASYAAQEHMPGRPAEF